jgi:HEAT repeats
MSAGDPKNVCSEISALLVFYVCEEVNAQERAAIEQHLSVCSGCKSLLEEELSFQETLESISSVAERIDASGILLSQCRSELAETLDDLEKPAIKEKVPAFGWLRGWMLLHPTWSAATLLLFGLIGGAQYAQWSTAHSNEVTAQDHVFSVRPDSQLTDDQLSKMSLAGINFSPSPYSGSKNVRVRLSAEQPMEFNGSPDDSNVRSVLTFVVKSGDRFDSGTRMDCLDALKSRAKDQEVRAAFLAAARKDQNPAVRLKALEALRDSAIDSTVREALLDALRHDSNPGVRVEAVNLLVRSLEETPNVTLVPDPQSPDVMSGPMIQADATGVSNNGSIESVVRELESLQKNDASRYVRLRSASALRELSARSDQ